jgi:serine/threonine-protein kinase RsbT
MTSSSHPIQSGEDVVRVRQIVRTATVEAGFGLVDQTKFITAASELARNTLLHGGGGDMVIETFDRNGRKGIRLAFCDAGPGIPDIERALQDGYSTGGGLGLGLSGARRLSNEFAIESNVGRGTRVTIARWK